MKYYEFHDKRKHTKEKKRNKVVKILSGIFLIVAVGIFWGFVLAPKSVVVEKISPISDPVISPVIENHLGEVLTSRLEDAFTHDAIAALMSQTLPSEQLVKPYYAVNRYVITFKSTDEKGEPITITTQYFIPSVTEETEFPLYVFGSGTTGIGDICAPSNEVPEEANWANYRAHMLAYASQGYIVVFPDYEGFNNPQRVHHYFNAEMESKVLLDAARSLYKFSEGELLHAKPTSAIFLAGFSQGGHAAIAAKDYAPVYAPELTIRGIVSYAPASNVEALLREAPALAPYILYTYADLYGKDVIDPLSVLNEKWTGTLEQDVTNLCVDRIYNYYGSDATQIYSPAFHDVLFTGKLAVEYPAFSERLSKNYVGMEASTIPQLILQGDSDTIVSAQTVKDVTRKLCASGNPVIYNEYPNTNHFTVRQNSFKDSLLWMQNIRKGKSPDSNCKNLFEVAN
ncbi:MAG: hypothetical protein H0W89_02410 [Candidatus Levybacteria bacterium]|nr:hypothetical protein [Candidatus Levybacteria bacterium]